MKRILAALIMAAMLLCAPAALAEGDMYDGEITFAEYTFGDTYENIRAMGFVASKQYYRGGCSSRFLADSYLEAADLLRSGYVAPCCFKANVGRNIKVAGYDCSTSLWFVYPVVDGEMVWDDNAAIMYCGEYGFWDDHKNKYNDLKGKLTQVYGEPFAVTDDIYELYEPLDVSEGIMADINRTRGEFTGEYSVWKSSVNNVMIVLRHVKSVHGFEEVNIRYIDLDADEIFDTLNVSEPAGTSSNLEGL